MLLAFFCWYSPCFETEKCGKILTKECVYCSLKRAVSVEYKRLKIILEWYLTRLKKNP